MLSQLIQNGAGQFQFVKIEKESVAVKIELEISQKRTIGFQNGFLKSILVMQNFKQDMS